MPLKPRPLHANAAAAGAHQPDRGVARNPGAPNLVACYDATETGLKGDARREGHHRVVVDGNHYG